MFGVEMFEDQGSVGMVLGAKVWLVTTKHVLGCCFFFARLISVY